jgi:hypothetical protein
VIVDQRSQLLFLDLSFPRQQELALRKEMGGGIGLELMLFLDFAASAWDVHFGLADPDR